MDDSHEKSASDVLREKAKTSKRVAWLLDECIRIPGTNIRFGLDPILGMIPGGGEFTATLVGAAVLTEAGKKGIPIKTLMKMGGNMLVNAMLGLVPGLGDIFSVVFKSNKRNYELLSDYLESEDGDSGKGGWGPLIFALCVIAFIMVVNIAVIIFLAYAIRWIMKNGGFFPGTTG